MKFYQSVWTRTFSYHVRITSYRNDLPKHVRRPGRRKWVDNSSAECRYYQSQSAQPLITGHDVVRTKYVHQVTALIFSCTRHIHKEVLQTQASSRTLFPAKDRCKIKTLHLNIVYWYQKWSYTYCCSWGQFEAEILSCTLFQQNKYYPGSSHSTITAPLAGHLSIFMI